MNRQHHRKDRTEAPGKPLRSIALIGKYHSMDTVEALRELIPCLSARGAALHVETETATHLAASPGLALEGWQSASYQEIGASADVAIVIGGDGTMLGAARRLARFGVPLVGVNQGRLGFMTDIARSDMLSCMDDLIDGRFLPEERMLLGAEVLRDGKLLTDNLALNDVVVDKGAIGRLLELELFIDDEFIYKLRADGLIVTTPTGSTAYALAANGPILHPSHSGIGLVPLCPHSLTNRPIVVGDRSLLELRIASRGDPRVHFDGQVTLDLQRGDVVRIRRSEFGIRFLHPPGYSYFSMLRQKLHWSERPPGP
jgi:NAD+ kinase